MTPAELLAAFDLLADAPDGVKRLRELVLNLAMRGNLVPQNPKEERVAPSARPLSPSEVPFALPESWNWLRLPEIADYAVGKTPATKEPRFWGAQEIPWVSIGDMPDGGLVTTTTRTVTAAAAKEVFRREPVAAGTLLMSFKLTIGKMAILGIEAYHNEAVISINPNARANRDYLRRVLPRMARGGESKDAIMGATLNGQSLARIPIPVPPLAEQHRIVARIDQLMALLDQLEAARTARDEVRRAARDAALAALRDAPDAEAVEVAWGRVSDAMDELFVEPEDVEPLRQAVLGLAVRGRLVRQDPGDGSPDQLLRQLREAGWSPPTDMPPDVEQPWKLPSSWRWVPFGTTHFNRDRERVPLSRDERAPRAGEFDYYGASGVIDKINGYLFDGTLLLIGEDGANLVLRSSPIAFIAQGRFWVNNHAHVLDSVDQGSLRYLAIYINAIDLKPYLTGTAQPKLNQKKLNGIPCALPPLPEQHRIVAKVEALMACCDALARRLTLARDLHGHFAAAAVHHFDV